MKTQFFNKLVIILIIFSFSACQQAPESANETVAADQSAPSGLSEAQKEMAGIELGFAEKRHLSAFIECTGVVEVPPKSFASVYTPVNGFVNEVKHLEGDFVRQGAILTTISHPDLVQLQRQFLESKNQLEFLKKAYERQSKLAAEDAAAQKKLEEAEAAFKIERARFTGLKAEIELIGLDLQQLETEEVIKTTLSIHAPVNGYVTEVNVNLGKLVTPQEPLFKMIDKKELHLQLQVFAKDIGRIKKGQKVHFFIPGSEQQYEAAVFLVGKMIDPESKTAMVHAHFDKALNWLTPGTYVQANIFMDEAEVLTVPETALVRNGATTFVFIQSDEGFKKVEVMTGRSDGNYIEITPKEDLGDAQIALKGAYYINGQE